MEDSSLEFQQAVSTVSQALTQVSTLNTDPIESGEINKTSELESPAFIAKSIFISWNGVLCLIFDGFPHPLEELKKCLNATCSQLEYKSENFGSQWAKVTLAGVRDPSETNSATPDPLTFDEFRRLKKICKECSVPFYSSTEMNERKDASKKLVPVKAISVVEYEWRSLEKLSQVAHMNISLRNAVGSTSDYSSSSPLSMQVSPQQQRKARSVLSEWDEEESYLSNVNAKGAPYRPKNSNTGSSSPIGLTCVSFLDLKSCPVIWECITTLKSRVDEEFPGRYDWFDESSLHCTIRAMDK